MDALRKSANLMHNSPCKGGVQIISSVNTTSSEQSH